MNKCKRAKRLLLRLAAIHMHTCSYNNNNNNNRIDNDAKTNATGRKTRKIERENEKKNTRYFF